MKNKKVAIIFIIIVIIVAILTGIYKILSLYLFTKDGRIEDAHKAIIKDLKEMENDEKRKEKVETFYKDNLITEQEAKEILGE